MSVYKSTPAKVGLTLIAAMAAFMVVTLWAGPDHAAQNVPSRLQSPGTGHVFGTDQLGRDFASRVGWAMRGSLVTAVAVTLLSGVGGGLLGLATGFAGGRLDFVAQRVVDTILAVPLIVLALASVAAFGRDSWVVIGALSLAFTPLPLRVARAASLSLRGAGFVDAARVAGAGWRRIVGRHLAVNVLGPWSAVVAAQAGGALLAESALAFVGAGGSRSLGALLSGEAQAFMHSAPWLAVFPGAAIFLAALAANLVGEGLGSDQRDV